MFSSMLGESFGWSTIQNGYLINDVMPVREHENLAASSGFASPFELHTEDAFHFWAGDYLGLLCLRNPNRVPTLFSGFESSELSLNFLNLALMDKIVGYEGYILVAHFATHEVCVRRRVIAF